MKKTTYAIIGAIIVIFAYGICVAAYAGATAERYVPMDERVVIEIED